MKSVPLRRALLVAICASPVVTLFACRGEVLDVGSTEPTPPDAAEAGASISSDLVVDGLPCTKVLTRGSADQWPAWEVTIQAKCGSIDLDGAVFGHADVAYPQPCTPATASFIIRTPGDPVDAGMSFIGVAGAITSGASLANPSAPLAFDTTVAHGGDLAQPTHHVVYHARGSDAAVAPSPDGVDANPGQLDTKR